MGAYRFASRSDFLHHQLMRYLVFSISHLFDQNNLVENSSPLRRAIRT
jgi:hypothetical protein